MICCALSLAPAAHAATPVVTLDDAPHDDRGPGHYVYPSGAHFHPGQFDLTRFEVIPDGDHFEVRVTLRSPLKKPLEPRVAGGGPVALDNGLYVQHVDIYIDAWPDAGHTEGLPGRRVDFAPEQGWDLAIVLTPRPFAMRAVMDDWGLSGTQVFVPTGVRHSGSTIIARVPNARLGGPPSPEWGWAVTVSGARWDQSFRVFDRIADRHRLDAYTLPVHTVAEDAAFGGGVVGGSHPQVIDLIDPPDRTQASILGGDPSRKRYARLPMIYPDPRAAPARPAVLPTEPAPAPAVALPPARIRDVLDATLVITDAPDGLQAYRLGEVLDASGRPVGKIVLTRISPEFVTATVVEGLGAISVGMAVRFPEPKE